MGPGAAAGPDLSGYFKRVFFSAEPSTVGSARLKEVVRAYLEDDARLDALVTASGLSRERMVEMLRSTLGSA